MKPLRVLSLFDGISCGQVALERAGIPIEVYYSSEIDKYAMQITQYNYPNTIQLGDVNDINFNELKGKIDLIFGGSPCFIAGTLVMTDKGMKPIQYVKEGDMVLTHKSRYRKVLKTGSKPVNTLYKITGDSFGSIYTTEEHPFYVNRNDEIDWVKCKDIQPDDLLGTTCTEEDTVFTEDSPLIKTLTKKGSWYIFECETLHDLFNLKIQILATLSKLPVKVDLAKKTLTYSKASDTVKAKDNIFWQPHNMITVIDLKAEEKCLVYNLEVEEDNSYTANSIIVHNCQDLSLNGKRAGLSGERSGLFYKFVEALEVIQPKYFLLENNVGMPQEAYEEISRLMGCYPIEINSAVLSAQNRRRFYWTNIRLKSFGLIKQKKCAIPYPEDKGITLNSILTSGIGIGVENKGSRITAIQDKADCLLARNYKGYANQRMTAALEPDENGKYKVENGTLFADDLTFPIDLPNGKYTVRRLTPLEYERLQTLDDEYTRYGREGEQIVDISNTQRYKAIGNGWTVDVIAYLFSHIKELNMEEVC